MTTSENDAARPGTAQTQNAPPVPGFDITILLLHRDKTIPPNGAFPTALRSASAMLQDLLATADFPLTTVSDQQIVTHAADIEAALRLIRRTYGLLTGFSSTPAGQAVCIGICVGDSGFSLSSASSFIGSRAVSDLVVLSPEAHEQAKALPGLTFKPIRQHELSGYWELCRPDWFHVTKPVTTKPSAPPKQKKAEDESRTVRIQAPLELPEAPRSGSLFRFKAVAAGVVLAGVVAVAGIVLHEPTGTPATGTPAANPASVPHLPTEPGTEERPAPSTAPVTPANTKPVLTTAPARSTTKKNAPEHSLESDEPVKQHSAGGMSGEDIRRTLLKADSASGNGQYSQAIAYYNFILRRDPHNAAALHGKARAEQNGRR